jgi:hypothetical protein
MLEQKISDNRVSMGFGGFVLLGGMNGEIPG